MNIIITLENTEELYELQRALSHLPPRTNGESIDVLNLDVRTSNCLKAENIMTLDELLKRTKIGLLKTPNLGKTSLERLVVALAERGLHLRTS